MKKLICALLALALLCGATALADIGCRLEIVNCPDYAMLRQEPNATAIALAHIPKGDTVDEIERAENGFTCVSWRGRVGYVLNDYLRTDLDFSGSPVQLSDKQRYNINLFLSNFTETGFLLRCGCYDLNRVDEALLTEFAIDHCWFNRQNRLEWGDYFNYNNVRLPREQIAPIVEKYFGISIRPSESLNYIDYRKGYYYWQETGGHTNDGFACLTRVERLSRTLYSVWFEIYGVGENWNNDVCYYTPARASKAYPPYGSADVPVGHAVIDVGSTGLDDRSGWSARRYTVCSYY